MFLPIPSLPLLLVLHTLQSCMPDCYVYKCGDCCCTTLLAGFDMFEKEVEMDGERMKIYLWYIQC